MEKIFCEIGGFGKFQFFTLTIIGLSASLCSMGIFFTVFIAAEPKLFCKIRKENLSFYLDDTFSCNAWSNLTKTKKTIT